MVIAVFFMLLGALGPIAAVQWRLGRWLPAARWIARNSSPHVLYATPVAGVLLACLGLSIIWPPAIVLVFLSAGAFMWALLAPPSRDQTPRAAGKPEHAAASREARPDRQWSEPASSRPEVPGRTDRVGGARRAAAPRRSRSRPTQARRDARRAS